VYRLRTSLCLQFKPHHIAGGAIFLAAKFLKVKLPSDGEKVWWQEFDVTPWQLEGWSLDTTARPILTCSRASPRPQISSRPDHLGPPDSRPRAHCLVGLICHPSPPPLQLKTGSDACMLGARGCESSGPVTTGRPARTH
jgi:hypothetical protein